MAARNRDWVRRFELERARFRWDLNTGELSFERAVDTVVAKLCCIGTVSHSEGTFRWAWSNDAIPAEATRGLDAVRTFGAEHHLELLTTAEWAGGRAEGLEMVAVAGRIQNAEGTFVDDAGDLLWFFTLHRLRISDPEA
jgi:hypothetical protein